MPAPSVAQLTEFFSRAFKAADIPANPKKLVQNIGLLSYAEATEFIFDVQRKTVLSLGQRSPASLIDEQMILWSKRLGAAPHAKRPRQADIKVRPARKRQKGKRRTK
jgi:hypothetical protein